MKHSKTLFLFAIAASFLFQGCKKVISIETVQKTRQFSFSRHALGYVQLQLGKYLIYKDSASAQLDSVVVTTSNLVNKYVPSYGGTSAQLWLDSYSAYNYEAFHLVLSKYNGNQSSNWFVGDDSLNYGVSGGIGGIGGNPQPSDTFWVNLVEMQNYFLTAFYCSNSQYSNLSMNIEGKTYSNVIETIMASGNPTDPGYKKTIYYWAKPVGIIKRTIIDASSIKTYTLLRNN